MPGGELGLRQSSTGPNPAAKCWFDLSTQAASLESNAPPHLSCRGGSTTSTLMQGGATGLIRRRWAVGRGGVGISRFSDHQWPLIEIRTASGLLTGPWPAVQCSAGGVALTLA